jgi:hypothetical protein
LSQALSLTVVELPAGAPPLLRRRRSPESPPADPPPPIVEGKPNRRSPLLVCVAEPYLAAGEPVPAVGPDGGRPKGIVVKISKVLRSLA